MLLDGKQLSLGVRPKDGRRHNRNTTHERACAMATCGCLRSSCNCEKFLMKCGNTVTKHCTTPKMGCSKNFKKRRSTHILTKFFLGFPSHMNQIINKTREEIKNLDKNQRTLWLAQVTAACTRANESRQARERRIEFAQRRLMQNFLGRQ